MPTTHLLARAVIRDDDHVLVVRAEGQSHTFLPGGHLEAGEGMEACLRRELNEELGLQADVGRYLGAVEHEWIRNGGRHYELNHCFSVGGASLTVETEPSAREEHLTFGWVSVDRLGEVALEPAPLRTLLAEAGPEEGWWASTVRSGPNDEEAGRLRSDAVS